MAIKKEIKAWAIKLRGRSFHQNLNGVPFLYMTKKEVLIVAMRIRTIQDMLAEPVRVKIRVEEV